MRSKGCDSHPPQYPAKHPSTKALNLITPEDKMLACLPIFHSFRFTVTLWYPIIASTLVTTVPNPLETRKIADVIEAEKATILLGTPTLF